MKQAITSLTVLAIAITPNLANANQAENQKKIAVVKKVISNLGNRSKIILANATPRLKQVEAYSEYLASDSIYMSCTAWEVVGGQDWGDQKLVNKTVKYKVLKNGNVQARFKINPNFDDYATVSFKLVKSNDRYLIDDIYSNGSSFIADTEDCISSWNSAI